MNSKFIVLEGIDGSGKSTQHKLLMEYLQKNNKEVRSLKFPRYKKSFWADNIENYLKGEFGNPTKIDPHLSSILFALDRFDTINKIKTWLKKGFYFIPDRWTTSNLGHQLGKLINKSDKIKDEFISWLEKMEYEKLNIPKPDKVIYLYVNYRKTFELLKLRGKTDKHESDIIYLKNSQMAYDYVCNKSKGWTKIDCMDGENILSIEKIQQKIIKTLGI